MAPIATIKPKIHRKVKSFPCVTTKRTGFDTENAICRHGLVYYGPCEVIGRKKFRCVVKDVQNQLHLFIGFYARTG